MKLLTETKNRSKSEVVHYFSGFYRVVLDTFIIYVLLTITCLFGFCVYVETDLSSFKVIPYTVYAISGIKRHY